MVAQGALGRGELCVAHWGAMLRVYLVVQHALVQLLF